MTYRDIKIKITMCCDVRYQKSPESHCKRLRNRGWERHNLGKKRLSQNPYLNILEHAPDACTQNRFPEFGPIKKSGKTLRKCRNRREGRQSRQASVCGLHWGRGKG